MELGVAYCKPVQTEDKGNTKGIPSSSQRTLHLKPTRHFPIHRRATSYSEFRVAQKASVVYLLRSDLRSRISNFQCQLRKTTKLSNHPMRSQAWPLPHRGVLACRYHAHLHRVHMATHFKEREVGREVERAGCTKARQVTPQNRDQQPATTHLS
jgi:hypothetical protein